MPMPTPPGPGEEPTDERTLFGYHFRRLTGWYIEALDALPADVYTWQPPLPSANTLAAILSHAVSSAEWWVRRWWPDLPPVAYVALVVSLSAAVYVLVEEPANRYIRRRWGSRTVRPGRSTDREPAGLPNVLQRAL